MSGRRRRPHAGAALVLGAVLFAACDSGEAGTDGAVGGTGDGGGAGGGGGTGLRMTVNGTVLEFTQNPRAFGPEGTQTGAVSVMGQVPEPYQSLTLGITSHVPGTFTCAGGNVMAFQYGSVNGQATAQSTMDCTITLTQAGTSAGAEWIGTFSANLAANGGFTAAVTDGSFRLPYILPGT